MSASSLHPLNVYSGIEVRFSGSLTDAKLEQFEKTLSPIFVFGFLNSTDLSAEQSSKELAPIKVTLSGIIILSSEVQSSNAR